MNQDIAQGTWTELKGQVKAKWAKLTEKDLDEVKGNVQKLVGKLQKLYGYTKENAEKEYGDLISKIRTEDEFPKDKKH